MSHHPRVVVAPGMSVWIARKDIAAFFNCLLSLSDPMDWQTIVNIGQGLGLELDGPAQPLPPVVRQHAHP